MPSTSDQVRRFAPIEHRSVRQAPHPFASRERLESTDRQMSRASETEAHGLRIPNQNDHSRVQPMVCRAIASLTATGASAFDATFTLERAVVFDRCPIRACFTSRRRSQTTHSALSRHTTKAEAAGVSWTTMRRTGVGFRPSRRGRASPRQHAPLRSCAPCLGSLRERAASARHTLVDRLGGLRPRLSLAPGARIPLSCGPPMPRALALLLLPLLLIQAGEV